MKRIFNGFDYSKVLPSHECVRSSLRDSLKKLCPEKKASLTAAADKISEEGVDFLPVTVYSEFFYNGNRSHYEKPFFARRHKLLTLTAAELVSGEGKYIPYIADILWAICEETTWVIPAHSRSGDALPRIDGYVPFVDLFAASTSANVMLAASFFKTELDKISPAIYKRAVNKLTKHIFEPILDEHRLKNMWWYGGSNNWCPWICENVLTAAMYWAEPRRAGLIKILLTGIDNYIASMPDDGGCDEGPSYWNVAGGSVFDCLEIISALTGGYAFYGSNKELEAMMDYIRKVHITANRYVNFADAPGRLNPDARVICRMGEYFSSDKLLSFGRSCLDDNVTATVNQNQPYRSLLSLVYNAPTKLDSKPLPTDELLPIMQAAKLTSGRFVLAVKGGNNAESHNHNDIGSFILFYGDSPLFIDAGVDGYTKKTFSSERYTIWSMTSPWHNVPEINGVGQRAGAAFRADAFFADENGVEIDYSSAYPSEAGVKALSRRISVTENGFDIIDCAELKAPGSLSFRFITAELPIIENNTLKFPCGVSVAVSPELKLSFDSVNTANTAIGKNWSTDTVYRVTAETPSAVLGGKYVTSVKNS